MKINIYRLFAFGLVLLVANGTIGQGIWSDPQIYKKKTFDEIVKETEDFYSNFGDEERKPGYKQYKRWKISAEMRLGENRALINSDALIQQEYSKLVKSGKKESSRFSSGNWIEEGPFGYVDEDETTGLGRLNCIAFHPSNPNILFVGAASGGLWRSMDNGATWKPLTDGLPSIGVSGITIDPNNANKIWILTGDGDGQDSFTTGILYSSNGGVTWEKTSLEYGLNEKGYGFKLIANPENINTQFALMEDGIFKTTDGWQSFDFVLNNSTYDLAIKPGDTTKVYAVSVNGLNISNNSGDNFIQSDGGGVLPNQFSRAEIAVSPHGPNLVYIFYNGGASGFPGFYKSEDSGDTWELTTNTPNLCAKNIPFNTTEHQSQYCHVLAVDPNNSEIIYTGEYNVFRSDDGGDNFELSAYHKPSNEDYPYVHADIHALEFNNGSLYIGCDGGLFKTSDGGQTYEDLSAGLRISQYYYIDVTADKVMGGKHDNGSIMMDYNDTNLAESTLGDDGFACAFNYNDPTIYYQSTQDYRYKIVNGEKSNIIAGKVPKAHWNEDFLMDPVNPEILFTARNEIYRTDDAGEEWDLLDAFDDAQNGSVTAMIQGISNRDILYVAKTDILVRSVNALSEDPGFVDLSDEIPDDSFISDMAVDPTDSENVYIAFAGFIPDRKVWLKNGLDGNWTNLTGSLPNVPIHCIVYHEGSNNGLFIGTEIGVFYRDDDLADWHYYGNNLPSVRVYDLKILPGNDNDKLFIGTHGRGIWSTEIESMACTLTHNLTEENNTDDSEFDGIKVYEADQSITSTRKIDGGLGTNVYYSAGDFIQLNPGFRAKHKSIFTAVLDGCAGIAIPTLQNDNPDDSKK